MNPSSLSAKKLIFDAFELFNISAKRLSPLAFFCYGTAVFIIKANLNNKNRIFELLISQIMFLNHII